MKAPKRRSENIYNPNWEPPDKEWLEHQYITLEKPIGALRKEVGAHWDTIAEWLWDAQIPQRTKAETQAIHARNVSANSNPNWKGGYSEGYIHKLARRVLEDAGVPEVCSWCGQEPIAGIGRKGVLEAHHKDHVRWNNVPENLCYLCHTCHDLEKGLWHLLRKDKIDLECEGRTMVIRFK